MRSVSGRSTLPSGRPELTELLLSLDQLVDVTGDPLRDKLRHRCAPARVDAIAAVPELGQERVRQRRDKRLKERG